MLIAYLLVILFGFIFFWISFYFTDFSVSLNKACLNLSPLSEFRDLYQSMVCGSKISHIQFKHSIKALGLIHLFIISGAHMRVIFIGSNKLFKNRSIYTFFVLLLYLIVGQFQISALRAFIYLTIKQLNSQYKLYWNQWDILLMSILFCLSYDLSTWASLSLILSWLACLAILYGDTIIKKSFYCFIFIFPVCSSFYPLSPITILINSTIGPLIATFIFPACILSFIIPQLTDLIDILWQMLIFIGDLFRLELNWGKLRLTQWSHNYYWSYCLFLHFFLKKLKVTQQ